MMKYLPISFSQIALDKANPLKIWPIKYAEKPPKLINKDIKSKSDYNYLFLSDLDNKNYACITARKEDRLKNYKYLDWSSIINCS